MNIAAVMVQSLVFVSRHGHVLFFLNGEFVHFFGRHFFPTTIPAALPVVFKAEKRFGCVFCFLFFEKELLLTVWFCSNATAGFGWVGGATLKKKQTKEPRKHTDTFGVKENGKAQEMVPASHSRIQNTRGVGKQVYIDIDIQSK